MLFTSLEAQPRPDSATVHTVTKASTRKFETKLLFLIARR
jgi:hypothetical protein